MDILRILNVKVVDSTNISITFTENLTPHLTTSNISILSETPNVPSSEVQTIRISGATLSLTCQPLTPLAAYFITLQSVTNHPFESINGDAIVSTDGVSNRYLITAPLSANNPVKNYLDSFLQGNIYNNDDDNTVIAKYIQSLSVNISRALYDIRQVKNENYLSFDVIDEQKIRGGGPFDRLNEEGAYEILRVGRTPAGTAVSHTFAFDPFPSFPVTLQRQDNVETLTANSVDDPGFFNINSLTFNFSSSPVTKVTSITFTLNTADPIYVYNIEQLGYQIKNSRYDQDFGFTYLLLEDNQIRINDQILSDPLFALDQIIRVDVEYQSKDLGIVVDPATVTVYNIEDATREVLPPIINIFNLAHAPITDGSNNIPTLGGIIFLDPNNNNGAPHPAFLYELPFRLNALPATPGQYSIDYTSGTVYVYGNDLNNDGTGPYPPLATYQYRLTYQSELDYVYDSDLLDLVSLPIGSLRDFPGTINFQYEKVLIPGTDYVADVHIEALSERIGNKLVALNALRAQNSPITNVFKIFNETSGEIYNLDRWSDDKVYFTYNVPPRLFQQTSERANFETISNELLFVHNVTSNSLTLRIFKIFLNNNTLVASTEDSIASSFNTSLVFSNGNVFVSERWFNEQFSEATNLERLLNEGEYMVDYASGIVYCVVSSVQDFNLGTVTYKINTIVPEFPHLISVDDIYYRISPLNPKNKQFSYESFEDGYIVPETLDLSDEQFLNENVGGPYQIFGGSIGIFLGTGFVTGVTNQVKFVRSIFEYDDLLTSTAPFNFAQSSTSDGFNITTGAVSKQSFENVQFDGTDYFVLVNENIPSFSSNITYTFTVTRLSDSLPLWDGTGTVVAGNPVVLKLPNINSPQTGDAVSVTWTISINNFSRVIVDYNKGDFFVDYTYLADEIILSYEYGDNVIDFRQNTNLPVNTEYFVSYRAGALRDALLKNFGTLVNVPVLSTFDVDFNRERYRDALMAALTSFIQGPTVAAIKNIGKIISHIEPRVTEFAFLNWSLGNSLLFPESISTTGEYQLLPAKFSNGALVEASDQTIQFPVSSNIRLEEGTFETWVVPQWDGLDNDAVLTFNIQKDGYEIPANQIFIGASEDHPIIVNGTFSLDKRLSVSGTPNTNKDGVFIYYDQDMSGDFKRWYVRIVDGYVSPDSSRYNFTITSTGSFYDSKSMVLPKPSNLTIFTGVNSLKFSIAAGTTGIDEGITFISDLDHYLLDFGESATKNRLSIFKDVSGYINFRVYDRDKLSYSISSDVSAWRVGELHHVAISWKLNTRNDRDEMHLFVDGFEVPNIVKFGQRLTPYLHEKYKAVNSEEIIGLADRDIISSNDLSTTMGSDVVSSSLDFSSYNLFVGDTIYIDEIGFNPAGYTILVIAGQSLTLDTPMPLTLVDDGRFSINRTSFTIVSDIDVAPNVAIATIHPSVTGTDLSGTLDSDIVSSVSLDFSTLDVAPGYLIHIDNGLLSVTYTILQVLGFSLLLDDVMPTNFSLQSFDIYSTTENEIPGVRAVRPSYSISKDVNFDNILTISNNVFAGDLILVRTLGLNHRRIKKQYYVWSDNVENVLMTRLPSPISLDETDITKIITPLTAVGPLNSTVILGAFNSINFDTAPPTNLITGRTISATISGNNVDFSTPVQITVNGTSGVSTISETITFSDYGTLDFINAFSALNYVNVIVTPLNLSKVALTFDVREKYPITHGEFDGYVPVIRYSYHMGAGYTLRNDGVDSVRDENFLFSGLDIGNYLVIFSPAEAAGYYVITGLSSDRKSLFIQSTSTSPTLPLPDFTDGIYQVLNVNQYRSGLQNGFFTFETSITPSQPYLLTHGFYELDYFTYARIKFDPVNEKAFIGSDFTGSNQFNGIIDEMKIYSVMLTDTRVGETIPTNQRSITKDFNSLKALKSDANTLMLVPFDAFPFENIAGYYINTNKDKHHFQSSVVINENFGNSLVILDEPIKLSNDGILDTQKQGSIEFWLNPLFDTANDPFDRYYFDAFGAIVEETVSVNDTAVKISAPASRILSVKLKAGDQNIDYFVGGKLEIDTQHAIQEEAISISDSSATVSRPILQVITVKIIGDLTGTDYFNGGSIGTDMKTIYLGRVLPSSSLPLLITYQTTENKNVTLNTQVIRLNRKLPYQNTKVVVNYIPQGLQGDRLSIFKDRAGYINFAITASGVDYVVRAPTRWARNTWHRVKASYKVNGSAGADEMRLFLDGYQYTDVTFGSGILFGSYPYVMGSSMPGGFTPAAADGYGFVQTIRFRDPINELYIGTQYTEESPIFSLIDNFRISNISRPIYAPYGEPIDVNFSTNLSTVFPVTRDLYTTYLMDFDKLFVLNDDFAILKNRKTGLFDFSVNILDSFGIVSSNIKSKEALEALIKVLKPANSRVFIQYTV
jgi:hypothetical protein